MCWLWSGAARRWWPVLWFVIKVYIFLFCYIWLRRTLPGSGTTS